MARTRTWKIVRWMGYYYVVPRWWTLKEMREADYENVIK